MEFIDENKIYKSTQIWNVDDIIQIGLLSFKDKVIIIDPQIFNNEIANNKINDGDELWPSPDQWAHDPVAGYEINQDKLGIIHSELNTSDAAWHSNSKSDMINFSKECPNEYQKWSYDSENNIIKHNLSNMCLSGDSTNNKIYKEKCYDANDMGIYKQLWKYNEDNTIQLLSYKEKCLDSNGNDLYLGKCSGSNDYQKWFIDNKSKYIKHKQSSKYLDGNKNSGDGSVYIHEKECIENRTTQFYKLFHMDINPLLDRGFKEFDSSTELKKNPKRWLYIDKNGTPYTVYYRIFYRTLNDYLNYKKCYTDNLTLDSYNDKRCKDYIKDNKKEEWIANMCIRENKVDENTLFDLCNNQLISNNVSNESKAKIIKKQIEFCKKDQNLIDNNNCKKFWNVNYNDYYTENTKSVELDDFARSLCKPGHNNYPFCNCLNNEKNKISYKDAKGKIQKIDDICLMDYCNDTAYRPSNYKDYNCPNQCIQSIDGTNVTIKDIEQKCSINITENTTTNDTTSDTDDTTNDTNDDTTDDITDDTTDNTTDDTNNNNNNTDDLSLFKYKNNNIKEIIEKLNLKFPIKISDNIYLSEEDLFIIIILLIFIFIIGFFKSKMNNRNYGDDKKYDDRNDDDRNYNRNDDDRNYN